MKFEKIRKYRSRSRGKYVGLVNIFQASENDSLSVTKESLHHFSCFETVGFICLLMGLQR